MNWKMLDPRMTPEHLGFLPSFLSECDPRPAKEQIDENYKHGGGWRNFKGFKFNHTSRNIRYPGDPEMSPLAETQLREETILFYESAWTLILQKDGTFEISRLD